MPTNTAPPCPRSATGGAPSIWLILVLASSIACAGENARRVRADSADSSMSPLPPDTGAAAGEQTANEATPAPAGEGDDPAMGAPGALAVLNRYFAAIDAHHFHDAYHLWFDDGAASGMTLEEFARGYDHTRSTTFTAGTPGRIEGAAGSRYIEIPVTIDAETTEGRHQRFTGRITLRRVVVPGADPDERSWHIYSAAIREIK